MCWHKRISDTALHQRISLVNLTLGVVLLLGGGLAAWSGSAGPLYLLAGAGIACFSSLRLWRLSRREVRAA